jgi:hypothetical protein|mmetsp:Transcript_1464/g.2316  ORF Transcript_1464/g.2316 Transcript_1464/m.2316 type:complete len:306 (+) Transcript_1464:102-1019(+)
MRPKIRKKEPSKLVSLVKKMTGSLRSKKEVLLDGMSLSTAQSDSTASTVSFENLVIPTTYAIDSDSGMVSGDETPIANKDWESAFGTRYESIDDSFHGEDGTRKIRSNILIEEEGGVSVKYDDRVLDESRLINFQDKGEVSRNPKPSLSSQNYVDADKKDDKNNESYAKPLEDAPTGSSADYDQFSKEVAHFESLYNNPDANPMELLKNHIFHGHLSTLHECSSEEMSASSMAELEHALSFSQKDKIQSTIGNADEQLIRVRWDCAVRMMESGANDTSILFDRFSTAIMGSCKENDFDSMETAEI